MVGNVSAAGNLKVNRLPRPRSLIFMSTAHRPTWNPSTGGNGLRDGSTAPLSLQTSAKDQPAHKKLKYRKSDERQEDKDELLLLDGPEGVESDSETDQQNESAGEEVVHVESEPEESEASEVEDREDEEEGSEEDSETDEEALMAELEKIRQERRQAQALKGNPLLNEPAVLKRRWDEETVFKGQQRRGDADTGKVKRFINDTTRSDYHRRFIDKFIK